MNYKVLGLLGFVLVGASMFIGAPIFFEFLDSRIESHSIVLNDKEVRLSEQTLESLRTGDLIFRKGYGPITDVIAELIETGPYDLTHCGIVIRNESKLFVAHAVSNRSQHIDGVVLQPIAAFLRASRPSNIHIVRWTNYTQAMDSNVEGQLNSLIKQKVPFDRKANYRDSKALYCNEMIVKIWMNNLHLIDPPKSDQEEWELFNNLSVLYNAEKSNVIYSTFPVLNSK